MEKVHGRKCTGIANQTLTPGLELVRAEKRPKMPAALPEQRIVTPAHPKGV